MVYIELLSDQQIKGALLLLGADGHENLL